MSDRKQALQDLLAKIEAGDAQHSTDLPFWKVWTPESADGNIAYAAAKAFDGSLDAAKALHEAVLPEWLVSVGTESDFDNHEDAKRVVATGWHVIASDGALGEDNTEVVASSDSPARAWLCAILKALIAEADT